MTAKYKQQLAISAVLVVVVLAGLYFLVFRKPKQEAGTAPGAGAPQATAQGAKAPATKARGALNAEAIQAALARALASGAGLPGAAPGAVVKPTERSRPDPFAPLFKPPPPPPPPPPLPPQPAAVQVGIPAVMAQALPPEAVVETVAREQGRMAGVLWNDRVYAIIETESTVAVVQPGDTVNGRTVRSISPQEAILASKGGEEVKVPLRGAMGAAPLRMPVAIPPGRPALPGLEQSGAGGEY
jgi:hypothetical protein